LVLGHPRAYVDVVLSLCMFFGTPPDAYTMTIDRACALEDPQEFFMRKAHRASGGTARISARHLVCVPDDMGGSALWRLRGGASVATFLEMTAEAAQAHCHGMQVLLLPQVVARLILADRWHTLLMLGRWRCSLRRRGQQHSVHRALRIFPDWPLDEWLLRVLAMPIGVLAGADEQVICPDSVRLTPEGLTQLASMLRTWSVGILRTTAPHHQAEQRQALQDAVCWLEGCAQRLTDSPVVVMRNNHKFSAARLLSYMRLSRLLRSGSHLSTVLQLGMEARWPGLFDTSDMGRKDPGRSTVYEWHFVVDMALLLYHQKLNEDPAKRFYRFGWSDATDLKGRQLLISRHIRIDRDRITAALRIVHQLRLDSVYGERRLHRLARVAQQREVDPEATSGDDDSADEGPWQGVRLPAPLTSEGRRALCKELQSCLVHHVSIPTGLALGHTDLASKMSATTHAFVMETSTLRGLRRVARSFVAYTTDMGTELGASEFRGSLESLVPSWHPERCQDQPRFEIDAGDGGGGDEDRSSSDDDSQRELYFPNAIGIPGMNHVIHNLSADVDHRLTWWPRFWKGLKVVSALLSNDQRRKRVWKTCVQGSPYHHMERAFLNGVPVLYEKRWGMIITFITRARPLLLVLRKTWSQAAFDFGGDMAAEQQQDQQGEEEDAEAEEEKYSKFSPSDFTDLLASNMWFTYMQCILQLHDVLESTISWAEGCSCHGHLMAGKQRAARLLLLREDFGPGVTTCPMAGLRADECAVGDLLTALQQSCAAAFAQLAADTEWALKPSEFQILASEFELGRQFLELGLKLKAGFWGKLPWKLAGLAHASESRAREVARSCVALWEATEVDHRPLHHRLTREFLDENGGSLRAGINLFVEGTPRDRLSARTQQRIACLKFWPCVERIVEASHKDMKKHAGHHRAGPVALSLAVRSTTVLEGLLQGRCGVESGDALDSLLECLSCVRRIKQAPEHLCLGHHPVVLHLRQCKARRSQWMKRVAELVYRCNVDEMFTETRGQQRGHKRAIERVRRQVKAVVEPRAPVSATSVLAHALTDHLREMLSEDSILSVPVCALQGLSEAISRGPVSSVGRSLWSPDEGDDCSAAADATVFCRIVHLRPARWKMMPLNSLAGVRVSAGALAVAPLHHFRLEGATGRAAADAVSFTADGISMFEAIADDATLQALRMHGKKWEVDSGSGDNGAGADTSSILVLVIKGLAEQSWEIAEVLRQLFEQRAFPCTTTRWTVLRSDRRSSPLFDLQRHGLVDSIDSLTKPGLAASWQFTQKGLKSVLTCAKLGEASALCDVRLGVPLRDRSSYELQLMLQDGGWAWHPLPGPRTRARQQLRAYSVGGPLLWYAGSSQSFMVIREYLLCLLDAEVLRGSGISEIPHGLAQHTYALLLRGIPLAQHPPPPAPARRRVLHLEPDGEEAGPPEEAAEAEEAEHPEHDGDDGDTDDDDDDEADAWSLTDALAAVIDEAEEDRSMQLAQPAPGAAAAEEGLPLPPLQAPGRWGCFTISINTSGQYPFGAYEGSCPWHAKNLSTGCKKIQRIRGPSRADREEALLRCKFWCAQAFTVERQRQHVFEVAVVGNLDPEMVEALRIDDFPVPGQVVPDNFADAASGAESGPQRKRLKAAAVGDSSGAAGLVLLVPPAPLPASVVTGGSSSSSGLAASSTSSAILDGGVSSTGAAAVSAAAVATPPVQPQPSAPSAAPAGANEAVRGRARGRGARGGREGGAAGRDGGAGAAGGRQGPRGGLGGGRGNRGRGLAGRTELLPLLEGAFGHRVPSPCLCFAVSILPLRLWF